MQKIGVHMINGVSYSSFLKPQSYTKLRKSVAKTADTYNLTEENCPDKPEE